MTNQTKHQEQVEQEWPEHKVRRTYSEAYGEEFWLDAPNVLNAPTPATTETERYLPASAPNVLSKEEADLLDRVTRGAHEDYDVRPYEELLDRLADWAGESDA